MDQMQVLYPQNRLNLPSVAINIHTNSFQQPHCYSKNPVSSPFPIYYADQIKRNLTRPLAVLEKLSSFKATQDDLKLLDKFTDIEKQEFVKLFCHKTGFPNLDTVKRNIIKSITDAIIKAANDDNPPIKVLWAGYDGACSVSRNLALPGSDIDKLSIIIDGDSKDAKRLRAKVYENADKVLAEVCPDELIFILPLKDIFNADNKVNQIIATSPEISANLKKYESILNINYKDGPEAIEFNRKIAEKQKNDDIESQSLVLQTAHILEVLRDGSPLLNNLETEKLSKLQDTALYKYSNVLQQRAVKGSEKGKITARKQMMQEFKKWPIDKQFRLIKTMLYNSHGTKPAQGQEFAELFHNDPDFTKHVALQESLFPGRK